MGTKGDKLSNEAGLTAKLLVEKLAAISNITSKSMFGGYGIFCENKMFGIVDSSGKVFLKADENSRSSYEAAGSSRHSRMPYYAVPHNVLEDIDELKKWAEISISIQK